MYINKNMFENEKTIKINGLNKRVKEIPDNKKENIFDPLVLKRLVEKEKMRSNGDGWIFENPEDISLNVIRKSVTQNEVFINEAIKIEDKLINTGNHYNMMCVYYVDNNTNNRPIIYYLHGGGFFMGHVSNFENQCKAIASKTNAIVFALDYSLSPECMFPTQIEESIFGLKWIKKQAGKYKADANKIILFGDSAGANLCVNVMLEESKVALGVLLYGALDLTPADETFYKWSYQDYNIVEEQRSLLNKRLDKFKITSNHVINYLYLQNKHSYYNPRISLVYEKDISKLKKLLIVEGEYDYFRICNDIFAKKCIKSGVEVDILYYKGMDHGFFDRIGNCPQCDDVINELKKEVDKLD